MKNYNFFQKFYNIVIIIWTIFICLVFFYYYSQASIYKRDSVNHSVESEFDKDIEIINWLIDVGSDYSEVNDSIFGLLATDSSNIFRFRNNNESRINILGIDKALELLAKSSKVNPDVSFHIIFPDSLSYFNNKNEWEKEAIKTVNKTGEEFSEYFYKEGREYFTSIKPIYIKNNKLSGKTDDNPGRFVGGISISVDLTEVNQVFHSKTKTYFFTYIIIWFLGAIAFSFTYKKIRQEEKNRLIAVRNLEDLKSNLEKKVQQRTAEIMKNKEQLQLEIEDRKQIQSELEKSRERYKNIIEHSTNLFYSHDINNKFTYISPSTEKFFDCSLEELPDDWTNLISDHPINELGKDSTAKALSTGKAQPPYELELLTLKGRKLWVEVHEAPLIKNGIVKGIIGALVDITEWKIASEKLKLSEAQFRELFSSAPDGITLLDEKGIIVNCNEAFAKMLGYSVDELLNEHITNTVHPEQKELFNKKFPQLLKDGELLLNKVMLIKKNGETIKVRRNAKVVYDQSNNISGIILHTQDITEFTQQSDIIEENEKLLKLTQKIAGIGSFKYDFVNDKWSASKVLMDIFEIDESYPQNFKGWSALVYPDDYKWIMDELNNLYSSENNRLDFVTRVVSQKSKSVKWVNVAGRFERDAQGRFISLTGSLQDITEKYLADKKLEEREAHLRAIFEAADDVSYITTSLGEKESKILSVSPGTSKLFGYTEEEIIGKTVDILHTEIDKASFDENLQKMKMGKPGFNGETQMIHKSGKLIDVYHRAYPLHFEGGKLKTGLAVTIDISEIKKARENLKKREEQLTILINSTPDIIYFKDANGKWLLANNSAIELLGIDINNYMGKSNLELAAINDFYSNFLKEEDVNDNIAWNSFKTQRSSKNIPISNSKDRIFDMIRVPLFNDDRSRKGLLVFGRDITSQKELENKLVNSKKLEAVGLMASRLAHEFKNILQSITGFSQFAQEGLDKNDRRFDDIEKVITAATKADSVVKKLLSAAKKFEIRLLKHNINTIVKSFVNTSRNSLSTEIEIIFTQNSNEDYIVRCDAAHIELVLLNLVLNSQDAMPDGGLIEISVYPKKLEEDIESVYDWIETTEFVCISVKDNGDGIARGTVNSIFEPFFTTKAPGKGTGLGLSSSFDIIKSHGGFIDVKSTLGKGSEFFVYIPLSE